MPALNEDLFADTGRSRRCLAALFDSTTVVAVLLEPDGNIVRLNKACERMFGLATAECRGRAIWDVLPSAEAARDIKAVFGAPRASAPPEVCEQTWVARGGRLRRVAWTASALPDDRGKVEFVLGIGVEVPRYEGVDDAVRESEHSYREFYENSRDGYSFADIRGRIIQSNRAFQQMLGYTSEELRHRTYADLTPVKWRDMEEQIIEGQALARGYSDLYEKEYVRKDGTIFPIEIHVSLIKDKAGRPAGTWACVRDVTERKRAEEENAKLETHLHQLHKIEAVGQLASGIAHDFSNLVTVILSCNERLKRVLGSDHPGEDYITAIDEAARQASSLTRSLLTFSGDWVVEKTPVLLPAVIDEGARLLRRLLPASIDVVVESQHDSHIRVSADSTQLHQVLLNLAINARDAMPDGGALRIAISSANTNEDGKLVPASAGQPAYACMEVTDTGTGMSEEALARIFEPFYTTKPPGQGTGLGLTIVEGIIKKHGGLIEVHSAPGAGTTFRIALPCLNVRATRSPERRDAGTPKGHGERVLIAQDNAHLRGIIALSLQSAGYDVVLAADGIAAGECLDRFGDRIQAIVVDVALAKRSGMDWLRSVRERGIETPAIVINAAVPDEFQDLLDDKTTLLARPFRTADLATAVAAMLERTPTRQEADT
ncbi:MAG: PAS domain S-box protein [Planctomycetota bacterium]